MIIANDKRTIFKKLFKGCILFLILLLTSCCFEKDQFYSALKTFYMHEELGPGLSRGFSYYWSLSYSDLYDGNEKTTYGGGASCCLVKEENFEGNIRLIYLRNDIYDECVKSLTSTGSNILKKFIQKYQNPKKSYYRIVDSTVDKISDIQIANFNLSGCFKTTDLILLKNLKTGNETNKIYKKYEPIDLHSLYQNLNQGADGNDSYSLMYFPEEYSLNFLLYPFERLFGLQVQSIRVDKINDKYYLYLKRFMNQEYLGGSEDLLVYNYDDLIPLYSYAPYYPFEEEFLDAYVEEFGCDPNDPSYCWFDLEKLEKIFRK